MEIQVDEIYTFKLNSGEELVAKVKETSDKHILINDPVSIGPNGHGLGLIPSMFTAKQGTSVRLNTRSIALVAVTDDNVRTKYVEATTGLQIPDKKVILG